MLYRFSVQHRQLQQWLKISLLKVIFDTIMSDFINLYKLFVITRSVLKGSLYNNLLEFGWRKSFYVSFSLHVLYNIWPSSYILVIGYALKLHYYYCFSSIHNLYRSVIVIYIAYFKLLYQNYCIIYLY